IRAPENPVPVSTLPTPKERDFCASGTFGPHNLHENRPGSFRSEETIFATYNVAGVRVFDIRDAFAPKEIAYWVPPTPGKLIDPRPNVALAAKSADICVTTEGLMYVTDWNGGLNVLQYEGWLAANLRNWRLIQKIAFSQPRGRVLLRDITDVFADQRFDFEF